MCDKNTHAPDLVRLPHAIDERVRTHTDGSLKQYEEKEMAHKHQIDTHTCPSPRRLCCATIAVRASPRTGMHVCTSPFRLTCKYYTKNNTCTHAHTMHICTYAHMHTPRDTRSRQAQLLYAPHTVRKCVREQYRPTH
eukprot:GDKI01042164.1.p2 GENE.GDKI01042164.1~~GDKI01042164.1.p2  ORF type:complete len:137 (+),score=43.82 GDKI01042164.1:169-579(+)